MYSLSATILIAQIAVLSYCGPTLAKVDAPRSPLLTPTPLNRVEEGSQWSPGVYKGLEIGKSLRSDVLSTLGPARSSESDNNDLPGRTDEMFDEYDLNDPDGTLDVYTRIDSGLLISVVISLKTMMSVDEFTRRYGPDFRVRRYEFVECRGDAGASQIKLDPHGQLRYLEYPTLGIAGSVNQSTGKVDQIEFRDHPPGGKTVKCK